MKLAFRHLIMLMFFVAVGNNANTCYAQGVAGTLTKIGKAVTKSGKAAGKSIGKNAKKITPFIDDAARLGTKGLTTQSCTFCNGSGKVMVYPYCDVCRGRGTSTRGLKCLSCNGTGRKSRRIQTNCAFCAGTGKARK